MSRIYKLSLTNNYYGRPSKIILIRPKTDSFDSFKEEIFSRFPDLNPKLELYYEDADCDQIQIIVSQDFEIFKLLKIGNVFVVIKNVDTLSFSVKNEAPKSSSSSKENRSGPIVDPTVKVEEAAKTKLGAEDGQVSDLRGSSTNETPTIPPELSDKPPAKRSKTQDESTLVARKIMSNLRSNRKR